MQSIGGKRVKKEKGRKTMTYYKTLYHRNTIIYEQRIVIFCQILFGVVRTALDLAINERRRRRLSVPNSYIIV